MTNSNCALIYKYHTIPVTDRKSNYSVPYSMFFLLKFWWRAKICTESVVYITKSASLWNCQSTICSKWICLSELVPVLLTKLYVYVYLIMDHNWRCGNANPNIFLSQCCYRLCAQPKAISGSLPVKQSGPKPNKCCLYRRVPKGKTCLLLYKGHDILSKTNITLWRA